MAITISQEPKRSRDGTEVFFVAIDNGMWFEFEAGASESKVEVDVYLADNTLVNTSDIVLFFGIDDKVFFDASPYIQPYLNNDNDNTYQSAVETDVNASQGFYLKYAEYPAASPGVFTQSSTYYASKSAKQFGDTYGQNMAKYVAVTAQTELMDLLTKQKTLPVWSGFPFSLSAITNAGTETYNLDEYDNGGSLLVANENTVTGGDIVEYLNVNSFNASTKKMNAYLSKIDADIYSMKFDGVDEYFTMGDVLDQTNLTAFSGSAWIKTSDISTTQMILCKTNGTVVGWDFYQFLGKLNFRRYTATTSSIVQWDTAAIENNTWYHVAFTCAGGNDVSNMQLYINGVAGGSGVANTLVTSISNPYDLQIGEQDVSGNFSFLGNIYAVAFWSTELTAANIASIYNSNEPDNLSSFNPVGWWQMTNGVYSGGVWTLTDAGSGANNASSVNMEEVDRKTCIPTIIYNTKSFLFDGVDDHISIGAVSDYSFVQNTCVFTISFWMKGSQPTIRYAFMGNNTGTVLKKGFVIYRIQTTGIIDFFTTTGTAVGLRLKASIGIPDTDWHHIAITSDGGTNNKIYFDGVIQPLVVDTFAGGLSTGDSSEVLFLGSNNATTFLDGRMDAVSIFNSELTQANISTIFNGGNPSDISALSPFGWWKFDDATFSTNWTIPDSGSGGNDGTSVNMTVEDLTGIVQKNPQFSYYSMLFDGTNDYINIDGAQTTIAANTTGSLSGWINFDTASLQTIIAFGDTSANEIIYLNKTASHKIEAGCIIGGVIQWVLIIDVAISINTWYHVAVTQDGTSPVIYIDSVAVAQTFSTSTDKTKWIDDTSGLDNSRIGCANYNSGGNTNFFDGYLDEISIFNKELSQTEVNEIYNLSGCETPTDLTTFSSAANLVGWWQMGEGGTFGGTNWTIPDASTNSNDGTSANMTSEDVQIEVKK